MTLINLKCNSCGGNIQMDDTKDSGYCMYCGDKFLVKEELVRIAVEHSGTVNLSRTQEADNLIIRANQLIEEIMVDKQIELERPNMLYDKYLFPPLRAKKDIWDGQKYEIAINKIVELIITVTRSKIDKALDLDPYNSSANDLKLKIQQLVDSIKKQAAENFIIRAYQDIDDELLDMRERIDAINHLGYFESVPVWMRNQRNYERKKATFSSTNEKNYCKKIIIDNAKEEILYVTSSYIKKALALDPISLSANDLKIKTQQIIDNL